MRDWDRWDRGLAIGALALGVSALVVLPWILPKLTSETKTDLKVGQKSGTSIKLGPKLAELYGIKAEPAVTTTWKPTIGVTGRVVANPRATFEVRAPFAGVLKASRWPALGTPIVAGKELGTIQARFSPAERLDIQSKAAEANEKAKGAAEVVQLQTDRVQRLSSITGIVPGGELDQAKVQLADAKAQYSAALMQTQVWNAVAKNLDDAPIALPILSPVDGEVVEIGAQPGAVVDAGAIVLKVVDFRQALARLDLPLGLSAPAKIQIDAVGSGASAGKSQPATCLGPTTGVDPASQFAGYFYAVNVAQSDAAWRPGLFVRANLVDPAATSRDCVAFPTSAVLYHLGRPLVYVEIAPGRYERREISVLTTNGDRTIAGSGVRAGEPVVIEHAQTLLSEEFRGIDDDD